MAKLPKIKKTKTGRKYFTVNGRRIYIETGVTRKQIEAIYKTLLKAVPHSVNKSQVVVNVGQQNAPRRRRRRANAKTGPFESTINPLFRSTATSGNPKDSGDKDLLNKQANEINKITEGLKAQGIIPDPRINVPDPQGNQAIVPYTRNALNNPIVMTEAYRTKRFLADPLFQQYRQLGNFSPEMRELARLYGLEHRYDEKKKEFDKLEKTKIAKEKERLIKIDKSKPRRPKKTKIEKAQEEAAKILENIDLSSSSNQYLPIDTRLPPIVQQEIEKPPSENKSTASERAATERAMKRERHYEKVHASNKSESMPSLKGSQSESLDSNLGENPEHKRVDIRAASQHSSEFNPFAQTPDAAERGAQNEEEFRRGIQRRNEQYAEKNRREPSVDPADLYVPFAEEMLARNEGNGKDKSNRQRILEINERISVLTSNINYDRSHPEAMEVPMIAGQNARDEYERKLLQNELDDLLSKGSGNGEDGLYNDQLDEIMSRFKDYKGTIMRDQIKTLLPEITPQSRVAFIINTDTHEKPGLHWDAIYIDARNGPESSNSLEWFDSFGRGIPNDILEDCKLILKILKPETVLKVKENRVVHQSDNTENCGYFCAKFLIDRFRGKSFADASGYDDKIKISHIKNDEKEIERLKNEPPFNYIY